MPEEFFDPRARIFFNDRIYWRTNWEVALENSMDSHVQYLHRDNLQALIAKVAETGAALGIAFDGDADRIGVVTASGSIVTADRESMLVKPRLQ